MFRMSNTVPTIRNRMITSPVGPARPPERVSPKLLSARNSIMFGVPSPHTLRVAPSGPRGRLHAAQRLPDAGEQVVLRGAGVDERAGELELFGRPGGLLDGERHPEPETVRVDLGRMRLQRLVPHAEVVAAHHVGGDAVGAVTRSPFLVPLLQPFGVRRLEP